MLDMDSTESNSCRELSTGKRSRILSESESENACVEALASVILSISSYDMLAVMRKTGSVAQTVDYNVKSKIGTQPALPTVSGTSGAGSEDVCNEGINRTPIHF